MKRRKIIFYFNLLIISIFSFIYLLPILVTITNSFMGEGEIFRRYNLNKEMIQLNLIPDNITFMQYIKLLFLNPVYLHLFFNSIKLVIPILFGNIVVSVFAAYSYLYLKFKFKNFIFLLYLLVMLMPIQLTLVPNYIMADFLHIKNNMLAIILPNIFHPLGMVLLSFFIITIPKSYIEAACIDGANHLFILINIIIPLSKPMIIAVIFLTFVENWNLIEQPTVFLKDDLAQPLSIFLSKITENNIEIIFAASSFYLLPAFLIYMLSYDSLLGEADRAGIKG